MLLISSIPLAAWFEYLFLPTCFTEKLAVTNHKPFFGFLFHLLFYLKHNTTAEPF